MKTLVVAINSSYIHTNPAVRILAHAVSAEWREYNINQPLGTVLQDIYKERPRTAAFSCYIWNLDFVLKLAGDLKTLLPETRIVLGGPEVSFDARSLMERHNYIDAIICGEAEEAFPAYLDAVEAEIGYAVDGVLYRNNTGIVGNTEYQFLADLDTLPPPFAAAEYDSTKILYYESSRGCPFHCAYCLSGVEGPTREKDLDKVYKEIDEMMRAGVNLVKFTDRTFNANASRATRIIQYIAQQAGNMQFHFEVALDLMNDGFLEALQAVPERRIQLEAGIQSCNTRSLVAVSRKTNVEAALKNAKNIMKMGNIHLHLDLIAGLPYEGIQSFETSFDRVYQTYPHHLQLGFLKLLKGSRLREQFEEFGIRFRQYAPYEVLYTAEMSADNLFVLKGIAELVERYYNTVRARGALDFITTNEVLNPFAYYKSLHEYCVSHNCIERPVSAANQYRILIRHAAEILEQPDQKGFLTALADDYRRAKIKDRMPEELRQIQL